MAKPQRRSLRHAVEGWLRYEESRTDWLLVAALLVAALLLYGLRLGHLPLRDWDEGLVAQVAREIWRSPAHSFTWLYPTLWDSPYFNKPPLVHWLIALAYQISGVNEWTARLPGALLSAISVPLLYSLGREVFDRRSPAIFAALVYLTMLPVVRHGRLAMLDGAIICFALVMMVCLLRSQRNRRYALGVGVAFGLICLTKGVMVGVLFGGIALLFLLWNAPQLCTEPYLWTGLAFGSIPVGLWYGAQWLHYGGSFLGNNLINQSLQRIWSPVEEHTGPPWYYLLEILKYGFPWIVFLPQALRLAWESRPLRWAKLGLVWGTLYFVAISGMATKLPWYVLPLYPALALMIGAQLALIWETGNRLGVRRFGQFSYSPLWFWLFLLLSLVAWTGSIYSGWLSPEPEAELQLVLASVGMTTLAAAVLVVLQNPQFLTVLAWGTYLSLLILMGSNFWIWELNESYSVKPVAAVIQTEAPKGEDVYTSYPYNRPSLNFYSDRQVVPAPRTRLKQIWKRDASPYLLLDRPALQQLKLRSRQIVGRADGWLLVTRDRSKP